MKNNKISKTDLQKWYAPQQRFSIRKYHFGAASVLLGVALALSSGATAAANTVESGSTTPSTVETTNSTAETSVVPAITETTTAEATSTPVVSERTATVEYTVEYQDESGAVVASVAKSTSTTTTDAVAIAIVSETAEVPAGYALAAGEASTTGAGVIEGGNTKIVFKVVKQVVASTTESTTTPSSTTDTTATTATTEPTTTETALAPATTNVEPAAETTTAPATIEEARTILEQVASEAAVLAGEGDQKIATVAADDTALQVATVDAHNVANQSEVLLADSLATLEQLNAQIDAVRSRIDALVVELNKYTVDNLITAKLSAPKGLNEPEKTVINDFRQLTEEEIASIIQKVRNANPNLDETDIIEVTTTGSSITVAGGVTVHFNGNRNTSATLSSSQTIIGAQTAKNQSELSRSINWFDFALATITYPNGNKVGPLKADGTRDVTYADGTTGTTGTTANPDATWLASNTAKYVVHRYYGGGTQNKGQKYEVLQEGMIFEVPTTVKGYELTARITNLAPKAVATDPNNGENAMFSYGDWTAQDASSLTTYVKERFATDTVFNAPYTVMNQDGSETRYQAGQTIPAGTINYELGGNYRAIKLVETTTANGVTTYSASSMTRLEMKSGNFVGSTTITTANGDTVTTTYKKVLQGSENAYINNYNEGRNGQVDVLLVDLDKGLDHEKRPLSLLRESLKTEAGTTSIDKGLVAFSPSFDTSSVGITFALNATYDGRPVDVNVIVADAEEAGKIEFIQYESDGTPWEKFTDLVPTGANSGSANRVPSEEITAADLTSERSLSGAGYNPAEWVDGSSYGDSTFGPKSTPIGSSILEVGLSRNVSNLSIYIASAGTQQGAFGFVVFDEGDAPSSYGNAQHLLGTITKDDGTVLGQPYFGNTPADPNFQNVETDPAYWTLDDVAYTNQYEKQPLTNGMTIYDAAGKEGIYTVTAAGQTVITYADGTTKALKNNEEISVIGQDGSKQVGLYNAALSTISLGTMPDEGERQLLDEKVADKYEIVQASDTKYVLKGVEINRGLNNDVVYASGWVDFNGNGKFDLNEQSNVIEVNADGTYDIEFNNVPQMLDTSKDSAGIRLRVSRTREEILSPTGAASSGEVEDFLAHVIHMPRGTEIDSSDYQDQVQTATIPLNAYFTANGKDESSNYTQWAQIDNTIAPQIVVTESVVANAVPTGTAQVNITDTDGNTVYKGDEVTLFDANGNELGTAIASLNPYNNTVEYYLTKYTEYDTAGNKVGTYKLTKAPGANNIPEVIIEFDPEPGYVGTASGIAIRAWDTNGNSTGWRATDQTIADSLASTTIAEKDKIEANTNNGTVNGRVSMDSTFIPTVLDVRPVGEDVVTEDKQGVTQTGQPTIPTYGTVETSTGEKTDVVYISNEYVILDTNTPVELTGTFTDKETYDTEATVTAPTKVFLADGTEATFTPDATIPAGTSIPAGTTITGSGDVVVNRLWLPAGSTVPAGSTLVARDLAVADTQVIRNGQTITIPAGQYIETTDILAQDITSKSNNRYSNVVLPSGFVLPTSSNNSQTVLATDTKAATLVSIGDTFTSGTNTYTATNEVIPVGSYVYVEKSLTEFALPNATHLDPVTGAVTSVPRKFTSVSATEIVIENEGTYTLDQATGIVTFKPHPSFIGTGTGVSVRQPDVDYNDVVDGDPVTSEYGTDYGSAKYTPIVYPETEATITRTIHYVFDTDQDATNNTETTAQAGQPVVTIDNQPVTKTQTLSYTREFTFNDDGSVTVTPWTPVNDANTTFDAVISPVEPGYTAQVIPVDHRAANNVDVSTFTPNVTDVTADETDNIDVYVVYTQDKQYAAVKFWDVYTGTPVELATVTSNDDPTLSGYSSETITYLTDAKIAEFEAKGYVLVLDDYKSVTRTFDTADDINPTAPSQVFNVYLTHKETTVTESETQEVTRTIKYVDEAGNQVAPDSVETLTFTRDKITDEVTKEVTYGEWKTTSPTDKFSDVDSPVVPNFSTENTTVEGTEAISPVAEDQTITVVYKPNIVIDVPPTDPDNPITPETPVPTDPKGRTYGELGLIEEVTFTVHHVYADGTPVKDAAGEPIVSTETVTFLRSVKLDAVTGEVIEASYGEWTPATQDFAEVPALDLPNYTPSIDSATRLGVKATDLDTDAVIIYTPSNKVVDPKDPDNNPDTPTPETPVPNDPKGRTYGDLGLVEEVKLTVHHVYADGKPVLDAEGKPVVTEETLTFTRTVQVDAVTGDIIAGTYTAWTPATQDFTAVSALDLENYVPSTSEVTKTGVTATDNDAEATIIYRTDVLV
ncbi:TPA: GEVED domain-containing protein, partial [Streptococcus suis]